MQIVNRNVIKTIRKRLDNNPVVAILGPKQCGKSTTAKEVLESYPNSIYLDLEKQTDLNMLNDIWAFFNSNKDKLICFDEIQLLPDVFTQIRSFVDENGTNTQFLLLGSASRDLINRSSETLAGRISYIEMGPFEYREVLNKFTVQESWLNGGFPRSILAVDNDESFNWRDNYIRTFLERDIPQLGFRVPAAILNNFWTMCAHNQGQLLNSSKLGSSLGVTNHTIKHYLQILEETFMIRLLKPFHENIKKRLVKSPKVYIRDTGIVHALLQIEEFNNLLGHPVYGFSYETYIIENLIKLHPRHTPYFFKTAQGDEIDLLLVRGMEKIAFEIKVSSSPKVEEGFFKALEIVKPSKAYIIAQTSTSYPFKGGIWVYNLKDYIQSIPKM